MVRLRELKVVGITEKESAPYAFAIITTTRLKLLLAQELFSKFLLALSAEIIRVGERTSKIENSRRQRLQNRRLRMLSQAVLDSGLAGDLAEADSLLIPPFYARDLLPNIYHDWLWAVSSGS
jgi:hypothetical protein